MAVWGHLADTLVAGVASPMIRRRRASSTACLLGGTLLPSSCQDDLDGLLNLTLPFAQQMLEKQGEFYPFGAVMRTGGEAGLLGADPGQGEHPASAAVLATMLGGIRNHRAGYRTAATCFDVRLPDSDAVRVELEHQEGQAIAVLLPCKKKRFGRGVEYASLAGRQVTGESGPDWLQVSAQPVLS